MAQKKKKRATDVRTRRAILQQLKQSGPQDAQTLAGHFGISAMAVRQHLYGLEQEKLVTYSEQSRPMGRPAKLWRPTQAANRLFPDAHAELTIGLLSSLGEAFGEDGLQRLLAIRTKQQIRTYRGRISQRASLENRLKELAAIRTEEGYMAEVLDHDCEWLLVENHCPICAAATECTGLCSSELEVFQAVLGQRVEVSRTEHIIAGARRCAYRVRRKGS